MPRKIERSAILDAVDRTKAKCHKYAVVSLPNLYIATNKVGIALVIVEEYFTREN